MDYSEILQSSQENWSYTSDIFQEWIVESKEKKTKKKCNALSKPKVFRLFTIGIREKRKKKIEIKDQFSINSDRVNNSSFFQMNSKSETPSIQVNFK